MARLNPGAAEWETMQSKKETDQRVVWGKEEAALGQVMVEKDQTVASLSTGTGPRG